MSDVDVQVTRDQIVDCARSWLGVIWRHQGRNRSGVDCGGLVACVGQGLGVFPVEADAFGYDRLPTLNLMVRTMSGWMRKKTGPEFDDRRLGDVVVMKPTNAYKWPSHLGILSRLPSGELGMIHSYNAVGTQFGVEKDGVIETHYAGWWDNTVALFEYPGLIREE